MDHEFRVVRSQRSIALLPPLITGHSTPLFELRRAIRVLRQGRPIHIGEQLRFRIECGNKLSLDTRLGGIEIKHPHNTLAEWRDKGFDQHPSGMQTRRYQGWGQTNFQSLLAPWPILKLGHLTPLAPTKFSGCVLLAMAVPAVYSLTAGALAPESLAVATH